MVQLRPYQNNGIKSIFDAWNPQKQNLMKVLFQMPTGTGKTTVFSEIVRKAKIKKKKVLIIVHRKELVDQIADRLQQFGVEAGIISASDKPDSTKDVQVATIQTLSRRDKPLADMIIIDECHHSKAKSYKKLWEVYPHARFLGVSATPARINGESFKDLYDILIPSEKLSFFIEKGYLVKLKHLVGAVPDLSGVKKKMKDYDNVMLKGVMLKSGLMANLVESYRKFALGRKMIVFAVDVEHSNAIVKRYNEAGFPAVHIDAQTPKNERKKVLKDFKEGRILILSNVDIVSEGFDVPDCEAVQLARPTKSLVLYLQQVGRCMRPAEGKEVGLVLDNAGLWLEHGLSSIDREWTLEGFDPKKRKTEKKEIAIDEEGIIREVNIPQEVEGLELIELNEDLEKLLIFESLLTTAKKSTKNNNEPYDLLWAGYRFVEYLVERKIELTQFMIDYCHKRINKEGRKLKRGFWYVYYNQKLSLQEGDAETSSA